MRLIPAAASALLVAVTAVAGSMMQSMLVGSHHDRHGEADTPPDTAWDRDSCACHRPSGTADVADQLTMRERALRKLPLPYSLALRLRDAGAPPKAVREYLAVPEDRLDGFYRMAEAKFAEAQRTTTQPCEARPSTLERIATTTTRSRCS